MTPTEVAVTLRQFNEWRRGDYEPSEQPAQPDPREIGEAIDAAIEMIERMGKMEAALQIAMRQNSHDMLMTGDDTLSLHDALPIYWLQTPA